MALSAMPDGAGVYQPEHRPYTETDLTGYRAVDEETATTSLGEVLGLGKVKDHEAYEALDWLLERQEIGRAHV